MPAVRCKELGSMILDLLGRLGCERGRTSLVDHRTCRERNKALSGSVEQCKRPRVPPSAWEGTGVDTNAWQAAPLQ